MLGYEINANGKINIMLDVLEKRTDGYHNIESIMHSINLSDILWLKKTASAITIECNNSQVPKDKSNLAYKAIEVIRGRFGIKDGIRIVINKRIPIGAGLGGGSADAAACLKAMNEMFSLGLSVNQLIDIGSLIGADVPFCILGGTALVRGKGEILTQLEKIPQLNMILIKPNIQISTAWAYSNLVKKETTFKSDINIFIKALQAGDIRYVAANMRNAFGELVEHHYPEVKKIRKMLTESGAIGSLMSGTGPVVFGIYEDINTMEYAFNQFQTLGLECFIER